MQHYYIQLLVQIYLYIYKYIVHIILHYEYIILKKFNIFQSFSGASDDWAKGVAKIKYSYTVELRDTGKYGFILPPSEILLSGKEAFIAVSALASEIQTENNKNI